MIVTRLTRHMQDSERKSYLDGVEGLRRLSDCIDTFQVKVQELDSDLKDWKARRLAVLHFYANEPDTPVKREARDLLIRFQDTQKGNILKERKKWERLLWIPKDGDTASFQDRVRKAKAVPIQTLFTPEKETQSGGRIHCRCPFHVEKSPSFAIFLESNRFWCFGGCASGGDAIDFYQKMHGVSMGEALNNLCH